MGRNGETVFEHHDDLINDHSSPCDSFDHAKNLQESHGRAKSGCCFTSVAFFIEKDTADQRNKSGNQCNDQGDGHYIHSLCQADHNIAIG